MQRPVHAAHAMAWLRGAVRDRVGEGQRGYRVSARGDYLDRASCTD
jgi:hypothetical protein